MAKKITQKTSSRKKSSASKKKAATKSTKRKSVKRTGASASRRGQSTTKTAKRSTAKAKKAAKSSAKTAKRKTVAKKTAKRTTSTKATARRTKSAGATATRRRSAAGLSAKDLDQFRRLLLQKRAQLVGDVDTLRSEALGQSGPNSASVSSSMPIHMADLGTDNYEKEFTLSLIEGERTLLREIDAALARIRDGTYGICQATGKPIGKARLKAKPWAKYCYEYVLEMERRGKRV